MDFTTVAVLAAIFGGFIAGVGVTAIIFGLAWEAHAQTWHKPPRT